MKDILLKITFIPLLFFFSWMPYKKCEITRNTNLSNKLENIIDTSKILRVEDLNAIKFIKLFVEKYRKSNDLNFITLAGDFPKNWVTEKDVEYLISQLNSKQKCCGYMNIFSSFISSDNGEVGGFVAFFLNSYIENKQINLGLNSNPKTKKEEVEKILKWYKLYKKNKKPNG